VGRALRATSCHTQKGPADHEASPCVVSAHGVGTGLARYRAALQFVATRRAVLCQRMRSAPQCGACSMCGWCARLCDPTLQLATQPTRGPIAHVQPPRRCSLLSLAVHWPCQQCLLQLHPAVRLPNEVARRRLRPRSTGQTPRVHASRHETGAARIANTHHPPLKFGLTCHCMLAMSVILRHGAEWASCPTPVSSQRPSLHTHPAPVFMQTSATYAGACLVWSRACSGRAAIKQPIERAPRGR